MGMTGSCRPKLASGDGQKSAQSRRSRFRLAAHRCDLEVSRKVGAIHIDAKYRAQSVGGLPGFAQHPALESSACVAAGEHVFPRQQAHFFNEPKRQHARFW